MKVALVHDWLTGMRGGEKVLEAIIDLYPDAELFTLICDKSKISSKLRSLKIHTSWLQRVPGIERNYRYFLPLMPSAIEMFNLKGFDLIISSSHCVAKGIYKPQAAVHFAYVHAPMRYIWDRYEDYFGPNRASLPTRAAMKTFRPLLQFWDKRTSTPAYINKIACNSRFISARVKEYWGRDSVVIYPFVDVDRFSVSMAPRNHYVVFGALAPYKRVDLAIEAFNRMRKTLFIIGSGQERKRLEKLAGPTVQFLGALSDSAVADVLSKSQALIFPGKEDFGIIPLEAMACGTPIIAFGEGGATETVTPETGVFFYQQTPESLIEAVGRFEATTFDPGLCRKRAERFSREAFQNAFREEVAKCIASHATTQTTIHN